MLTTTPLGAGDEKNQTSRKSKTEKFRLCEKSPFLFFTNP